MKSNQLEPQQLQRIISKILKLRNQAVALEQTYQLELKQIRAPYRNSARNLIHYLAIRRQDIRSLQLELQSLGLSSLGRMEANVLATLNAVLLALHRMAGSSLIEPVPNLQHGLRLLQNHATRMLGKAPQHREVRIMVTMPDEAATDPNLIAHFLECGMNVMRINCAHNDASTWAKMLEFQHQASHPSGQDCRISFDLAGPKLRTGLIESGAEVIKIKPKRDQLGRVVTKARVVFSVNGVQDGIPLVLISPKDCLLDDEIHLTDTRGRKRVFRIVEVLGFGLVAETDRTVYLTTAMPVYVYRHDQQLLEGQIGSLPPRPQALELQAGDTLILTHDHVLGSNARLEAGQLAHIGCTLPQVFLGAKAKQRILFDDGKITGIIQKVSSKQLEIQVTNVAGGLAKLRAEKGINLPDTDLSVPALTEKDLEDLKFIIKYGDMVSLSFVRHRQDIELLIDQLEQLEAKHLGIILKIENRQAFENLPSLLLAALRHPPVAVMIARGDLGVEIGFERLAEVQEEILWLCEAAHIPVIWATQVLDSLAKNGVVTRAEVTDAAMSGRAECVMLNKGAYIPEALLFLDDVLKRMKQHQSKKTSMLRRLKISSAEAREHAT